MDTNINITLDDIDGTELNKLEYGMFARFRKDRENLANDDDYCGVMISGRTERGVSCYSFGSRCNIIELITTALQKMIDDVEDNTLKAAVLLDIATTLGAYGVNLCTTGKADKGAVEKMLRQIFDSEENGRMFMVDDELDCEQYDED